MSNAQNSNCHSYIRIGQSSSVRSCEKATFQNEIICVRSASQKLKKRPINGSNLHIQDDSHQYVAIHHISLTSHYIIVNNGSILRFFSMANSLLPLVVCFKVKVIHWVKDNRCKTD